MGLRTAVCDSERLDITSRRSHSVDVLSEPLRGTAAKTLIRAILQRGSVSYSAHAREELAKDKLTIEDAANILRCGIVDPGEIVNGTWRYPVDVRRCRVPFRARVKNYYRMEASNMNCFECGCEMTSRRETYQYAESGLPNVVLGNVEVRRCRCGENEVVLQSLDSLHRTIALAIIRKRPRLTGTEVRFLRKHLGWSGVAFAKHMGVTPECVSRWETGHDPIGPTADRLLRLMVAQRQPAIDYSVDELCELTDTPIPISLRVVPMNGAWGLAPAAS